MAEINDTESTEKKGLNFVEQIVWDDLQAGKNGGRLNTRFPPEPNGYLHIGHAKAICMDFGVAEKFGGTCNLRFDDTNPVKEDVEYVDSIREDIHWLGFDWGNREYYASDYFPQLYDLAIRLIKEGKAYVDDQTSEEIAAQKGTPTIPGIESPYRNRSVEENLDLFQRMNAGEFEEGARVLRAKIDMASSNMHFRDPIMYRIIKHPHHRTGTTWKVYPMYDFAHGQSDFFEGVTHSICTLEFVPRHIVKICGHTDHRFFHWFSQKAFRVLFQPFQHHSRQFLRHICLATQVIFPGSSHKSLKKTCCLTWVGRKSLLGGLSHVYGSILIYADHAWREIFPESIRYQPALPVFPICC